MKLEETVGDEEDDEKPQQRSPQLEATPGSAVLESMSTKIKPDDTCYTIRKKNRVIAVLVEAKLTKHKKIADVTAQVSFYSGKHSL